MSEMDEAERRLKDANEYGDAVALALVRREQERNAAREEAATYSMDCIGLEAIAKAAERRAVAAQRQRDSLIEALERIADVGSGIPDWRAMADCARAALVGVRGEQKDPSVVPVPDTQKGSNGVFSEASKAVRSGGES